MEGTGLNCDYTVCMQGECFNVRCKSCKPPSPPPHPTNHHGFSTAHSVSKIISRLVVVFLNAESEPMHQNGTVPSPFGNSGTHH